MRSAPSALLLFLATSLWGAASAVVAVVNSPLSPPLVAGGASVVLVLAAAAGRQRIIRTLRCEPRFYLLIGGLEAANLVLYFAALNIGPTPVVVALHLSTPVLLIGHRLATRQRKVDLLVCSEVALILIAIALVVADPVAYSNALTVSIACVLSLGSAVAVAVLISTIASESENHPAAASAAIQLALAALASLPLLVFAGSANPRDVVLLFGAGALFLGPGFLMYWVALKRLDATTAGVIGLNEAVVASILVGVVRAGDVTLTSITAGALILVSVGLELLGRRSRVRD
jgi:drug/metabolite transporter (DMT)-like permease